MESARRILELCYMTSGITCDSGNDVPSGIIDAFRYPIEGFNAVRSKIPCLGEISSLRTEWPIAHAHSTLWVRDGRQFSRAHLVGIQTRKPPDHTRIQPQRCPKKSRLGACKCRVERELGRGARVG